MYNLGDIRASSFGSFNSKAKVIKHDINKCNNNSYNHLDTNKQHKDKTRQANCSCCPKPRIQSHATFAVNQFLETETTSITFYDEIM